MDNFFFIYSVGTITSLGEYEMVGMILDHDELHEVINDAKNSGGTLTSVSVSMYNQKGEFIAERDITCLFTLAN